MNFQKSKDHLDLKAVFLVFGLTLIWGFNYAAIKYSNQGISPVFASALRSIIASICGVLYCLKRSQPLFHKDILLLHGFVVGVLFGVEFVCLYLGMLYTDAARSVIFVYLSPFIVALGAHFLLKNDRLSLLKTLGLILAFIGVLMVFRGKPKSANPSMMLGDILEITAGILWAATTLYIKRFMADKIHPINSFLYQLVFSIPILMAASFILEPQWIYRLDMPIIASMLYQAIIVAFISYLVWFKLIHAYSVTRLSVFSFFTPIFGVVFGAILLGEALTISLTIGLAMVSVGIFMVNRSE